MTSANQLADRYNMTPSAFLMAAKAGKIPYKKVGRQVLIDETFVEQLVKDSAKVYKDLQDTYTNMEELGVKKRKRALTCVELFEKPESVWYIFWERDIWTPRKTIKWGLYNSLLYKVWERREELINKLKEASNEM